MNKLGEGAFGQVFKVKRKADGKEYALKKVLCHIILGENRVYERKVEIKCFKLDKNFSIV